MLWLSNFRGRQDQIFSSLLPHVRVFESHSLSNQNQFKAIKGNFINFGKERLQTMNDIKVASFVISGQQLTIIAYSFSNIIAENRFSVIRNVFTGIKVTPKM